MEKFNLEKSLEETKLPVLKIFISYSWKDSKTVTDIAKILSELNIEFFRDKKDIKWGDNIENSVGDGLSQCSHLLVVISPATANSWWVPFEMGRAVERGTIILPYLINNLNVPTYISKLNRVSNKAELRNALNDIKQKHEKALEDYKGEALGTAIISGCANRYNEANSYEEKIDAIEYCAGILSGVGDGLNMSEKLFKFYIEICFRYGRLLTVAEAMQAFGDAVEDLVSREDEELNSDLSKWVLSYV